MVIIKRIAKRACATLLASTILTSMLSLSSISAFATEVSTQADTQTNVQAEVQDEAQGDEQLQVQTAVPTEAQGNRQGEYAGVHYATGDLTLEDGEYPEDAEIISTPAEYYSTVYGDSKKERAAIPLPESCDNSSKKYFPPIGNQSSIGSCTCWAQVYYQYSYTVNKMLNREATYQNSFSPKFAYNLANFGEDEGSGGDDVYEILSKCGAPSLETLPYDDECFSWSFDENVWTEAAKYKLKSYQYIELPDSGMFVTSADDSDLDTIKTALANGDVLAYSTLVYSWKYGILKKNPDAPENDKFAGQQVVTHLDGLEGGHRMAIVGYNDNIWTDINSNQKVDNGEMGAFKIVNSWSEIYGNGGFIWVAYDALNSVSSVKGVDVSPTRGKIFQVIKRIEVEEKDPKSNVFLKYTVNSATRTKTPIKIVAEKHNTKLEDYLTPYNITFNNNINGVERAFDGTNNASDATFYADLTEYFPELNSDNISEYSISVVFSDTEADSKPLTVKNVEIVDNYKNRTFKPAGFTSFTLDGAEKTVDILKCTDKVAIVYYSGYQTPNIEYKTQNGSWVSAPGYAMELSYDVDEYTHKYVIHLSENESSALLRFNDGNGSYDTNKGSYYTAYEGLNYFNTTGLTPPEIKLSYVSSMPDDGIADIYTSYMFTLIAEGGFGSYKYKYSQLNVEAGIFYESDFREDRDRESFWFFTPGEYVITFTVEDRLGNQATTSVNVTVEDLETDLEYFKVNYEEPVYAGEHCLFEILTKNEIKNYGSNEYLVQVYNCDTGVYSPYLPVRTEYVYKNKASIAQTQIYSTWKATTAGSYIAYITIKDATGNEITKSVNFKVLNSDLMTIDSFVVLPDSEGGVYEIITMTASATGGTGTLAYKFSYKNKLEGREYVIQDYSAKNTTSVQLGDIIGEYELIVNVKDSLGKVLTEKKTFTLLPTYLSKVLFNNSVGRVGETVKIMPVIENEASVIKPEHYHYTVEKDGVSQTLATSSDKTASWTPTEKGEYIITVEIIYDSLTMVNATVKYTVTDIDVEGNVIYFIPSEDWKQANARFAVYAWNGGVNEWASLTEADGVYVAELSDEYSNVIFCRMNPSTTENNWDNRWNQTADLTKPADKNCFTVNAGEWTGANGTWSEYIPATKGVSIVGDIDLTLEETDENIFTGVTELQAGTYSFNVDDNGTTRGFNYTYTDTATIDYSAGYKSATKLIANGGRYKFTYNASTKVLKIKFKSFDDIVELFGDINVELVRTLRESTVFTGSARVEAGTYSFKINEQGTTMGFGYTFDDVVYGAQYNSAWSGATNFNATGGIYSVAYDIVTNKLTFKHAPKGLGDVRIFGDINLPLASQGNNVYSAQTTLEAGTYQFRIDSLGTTVCNGSEFTDIMNGVVYNPDWKAATTFISTEKQKFTIIFDAKTNIIKIFNAPIDTTKVLVAFEDNVLILTSTDGVNYTATTTLNAGTYAFRMDEFGVTMGFGGIYTDTISGAKYSSSYSSATTFTATGGEYTFSYNVNTDVLKVTKA